MGMRNKVGLVKKNSYIGIFLSVRYLIDISEKKIHF